MKIICNVQVLEAVHANGDAVMLCKGRGCVELERD